MADKKEKKKQTKKETEVVNDILVGVVNRCLALNLRKEPSLDAPVIELMGAGTEVEIDNEQSTDEFYKVRSMLTGSEGYGLKAYVDMK